MADPVSIAIQKAKEIAEKINKDSLGKRACGGEDEDDFPEAKRQATEFNGQSGGRDMSFGHPGIPKLGEGILPPEGVVVDGLKHIDMMIPGTKVGLIIGKGGETIRNLQERSHAKMTIHQTRNDPSEKEKQLRISGSPEDADRCKQMVIDLIEDKERESHQRSQMNPMSQMGGGMNMGGGRPPRNEPSSGANGIPIGGGDRMGGMGGFGGGGGGGYMGGDRGAMGGNRVGFGFHGPPTEVAVPPTYIGLVIGKGGESIKKIQMETGTKIQFDTNRTDGNGNKVCSISGSPDAIKRAENMIQDIIDQAAQRRPNPNQDARPPGVYQGGQQGGSYGPTPGGLEVKYSVPANRCGAVIGRGGDTIRQIKASSGCDIELDKMSKNSQGDEKLFVIRGTPENIEVAKKLINEKVRGGPGMGGSSSGQQDHGGHQQPAFDQYQQSSYYQQYPQMANQALAANGAQDYSQYYAQYYASLATPAAQPVDPSNNGQADPGTDGASGAAGGDYTKQWIEYYRAMGNHAQADQLMAYVKNGGQGLPGGAAQAAAGGGGIKSEFNGNGLNQEAGGYAGNSAGPSVGYPNMYGGRK